MCATVGRLLVHRWQSKHVCLDPVADPLLDIGPSVSEMLADAESWWALAVVSPRADRGDLHAEILSEIFNGKQPIEGFHGLIF